MESNSDKQLRDKLTGVEFPFDPQAWEQMEDMLDKKKKRRGFFWWWTGGIAAALLFAIVGYELGVNSGNKQIAISNEQKTEVKSEKLEVNTSVTAGNSSAQENVNAKQQAVGNESQIVDGKSEKQDGYSTAVSSSNEQERATGKRQKTTIKQSNNQTKTDEGSTASISSNPSNPNQLLASTFSKKQKRKQQLLAKANEGGVNTTISSFEKNSLQDKTDLPATSATKDLLAKRIEMDGRAGFLESSEEKYSFDKRNEDALPKTKKKIFNYSLGVVANVSGAILDNPDSLRGFYNKPSYAVGFTHEFLFLKRIAITNSILYSQTGFKVYHPVAPSDSSTTTSYTSAISELQIPIGIKAYPFAKKWFRFSIAAGIINHIKLTETFKVEKIDYNSVNMYFSPNTFVSTADNPFVEGLSKSANLQSGTPSQGEQAEYYGMGGLRRYYASFYASAGVEFIAKKQFVFFTEPMFYMSLNKIGLQDKRKYNVGVSGGFRYQF